jgi:hypothetical protein
MKFSLRDLLWLTVLVAVLLAWWLQWQEFRREREAIHAWRVKAITLRLLAEEYAAQDAEVSRLTALVKQQTSVENPGQASELSKVDDLQLSFAKSDLKRAEDFRAAFAARIAELAREIPLSTNK